MHRKSTWRDKGQGFSNLFDQDYRVALVIVFAMFLLVEMSCLLVNSQSSLYWRNSSIYKTFLAQSYMKYTVLVKSLLIMIKIINIVGKC